MAETAGETVRTLPEQVCRKCAVLRHTRENHTLAILADGARPVYIPRCFSFHFWHCCKIDVFYPPFKSLVHALDVCLLHGWPAQL
jgi:hypothetical protein